MKIMSCNCDKCYWCLLYKLGFICLLHAYNETVGNNNCSFIIVPGPTSTSLLGASICKLFQLIGFTLSISFPVVNIVTDNMYMNKNINILNM